VTIQIKTRKLKTGGSEEIWHTVWFNVVIDGMEYVLRNAYDDECYLIEAEWISDEEYEMPAMEFTERYTLGMITGMQERTV